jgi:hypothetical protein
MKIMAGLLMCGVLTGCATGPPAVGSRSWYQVRTQEIEGSYEYGEISKDQYLELRNEADQIRVDYQKQLQSRLYYGSRYGSHASFGYRHYGHGHHGYGHSGHGGHGGGHGGGGHGGGH